MSARMDLDRTCLPTDFAAWYDSLLDKVATAHAAVERIVRTRLPRVEARMIRSTRLGAEVLRVQGGYEIRLTAALPAIVHYTFNNLLRTPHYMRGVGEAQAERRYRESSDRIPLALPRGLRIEQAVVAITSLSRPRDQHRAATAVLMTELAMAFSAYHELAHVLLGHVDAHRRWCGRTRLLEVAQSAEPTPVDARIDARTRFVWEYEADLVAANMLLQDMVSPAAELAFRDAFGPDTATDVVERFQAMLGAVLVVFLLIAQASPARRRTHPDPLVRYAAVANDSAAALVEQHPQLGLDLEAAGAAVNDAAAATLRAWSALGLKTSAASPLKLLLTAQTAVERLQRDRHDRHTTYSGHALFYPFKENA